MIYSYLKITWEQVKELVPEQVYLYHISQGDSLDNSMAELEQCIHANNFEVIEDKICDWFVACENYDSYLPDIQQRIQSEFALSVEQAAVILAKFEDNIKDLLDSRDKSNVLEDLLRYTSKVAMFYDTGYEVDGDSYGWNAKEMKDQIKGVKRALKLKLSDTIHDEEIREMLLGASYGGNLVIYFYDNVQDWIGNDQRLNAVQFTNYHAAIIDTNNGSGADCHLEGANLILPFNRENLFVCKNIKYSYTHSVCGMYDNWCKETTWQLLERVGTPLSTDKSNLHKQAEKEKEYNKTFQLGKCSIGDMDINRHRKVTYINYFPCGNKCPDCGTFWID